MKKYKLHGTVFIFIGVFILLCIAIFIYTRNNIEGFETYSYGPYNYMSTGASPLTFYNYPIYRKPYMYPYQFYSSYPYPYMSYYETNI
jgi:hypothetical protein